MPGLNNKELANLMDELAEHEISLRLTKGGGLSVGPRSRVNRNLAKRIKKHKAGLIAMVLQVTDAWDVNVCAACLGEIPDSDPQITIEDPEDERRWHYHVDKECQKRAGQRIADSAGTGQLYLIHLVHGTDCNDAENRYDCKGGCFRAA